jgi:hypothetical protein
VTAQYLLLEAYISALTYTNLDNYFIEIKPKISLNRPFFFALLECDMDLVHKFMQAQAIYFTSVDFFLSRTVDAMNEC